jgi:hypothetical protein
MDRALSGGDILELIKNKGNLLTYPQLKNYDNILDVLGKHGCAVILYLTKAKNYGHWICIIRHNDHTIEFFDSYGIPLDSEFGFITKEKRQYLDQNMPYLSKLLYKYPYKIIYNDQKLQKNANNINTCGRHVVVRILNRNMDVDDYVNALRRNKKYTPDQMVTFLT